MRAGADESQRARSSAPAFCFAMNNPRYQNGNLRRKHRARIKAAGGPCGICRGALGPIRYDQPSDAQHPLSFVLDEIRPVSRWREFGYDSPQAAADDWNNLQPAHWICNARKGARTGQAAQREVSRTACLSDGAW